TTAYELYRNFPRDFYVDPRNVSLATYFWGATAIENATRQITLQLVDKRDAVKYCHGTFARARGEVYFITAAHCANRTPQSRVFTIDSLKDIAVHAVVSLLDSPISDYGKPEELPLYDPRFSTESVLGRLAVSFSMGRTKDSPFVRRKTHFSFLL